jgi:acetyl-CoA acetyltransferase family protein
MAPTVASEAFFIDGVRTVFGKAGGKIAAVRPDDLAATVIAEVIGRNPGLSPDDVDDVYLGATNQAGDDSRNVARIAAVLAGLPHHVAGATVNRLCGSGIEAVATASRAVKSGEIDVCIAGGAESMSRAPFILPRAEQSYQREQAIYDSRLGWRSVNPRWRQQYGAKTLIECAELIADLHSVSRAEQDEYSVRSHLLAAAAWDAGRYAGSVLPVRTKVGVLDRDETVRPDASMETLTRLRPLLGPGTSITAGNASPMNDGAAATLIASGTAVERYGLTPKARIVGTVSVGVHPDSLDGPVPATRQLLERIGWDPSSVDAVEMTEAYASQVVACVRELKLDLDVVNAWGGAIAVGHPLGASGTRLVNTLVSRLLAAGGGRGVATMCIGVGQGISMAIETC